MTVDRFCLWALWTPNIVQVAVQLHFVQTGYTAVELLPKYDIVMRLMVLWSLWGCLNGHLWEGPQIGPAARTA
jgi:hypothetical protein